jgi:hypothetical protein
VSKAVAHAAIEYLGLENLAPEQQTQIGNQEEKIIHG